MRAMAGTQRTALAQSQPMDCAPAATGGSELVKKLLVRIVARAPLCAQGDAKKTSAFHAIANSTEHGTVYLAAYDTAADLLYEKLEEKKIYKIENAYKTPIPEGARYQYSDRPSYRFVLKVHTKVKEIKSDAAMQFAIAKGICYKPIAHKELPHYITKTNTQAVDAVGVYMHSDDAAVEHTRAADGSATSRRTVYMEIDGEPVDLVLWGAQAEAFRPPEGDGRHLFGVKNVAVKEAAGDRIALWSGARTTLQWR